MVRKLIQTFNRYLFYTTFGFIVFTMCLTLIDVTGRYFRHPLPGTQELNQVMLAVYAAFAFAHTQALKANIVIDLIFDKFIPSRAQNITNVVTSSIALILTSLIAWRLIPYVLYSKRASEWTDILMVPVWLFKAGVFLGMFCLCLQLILDIIDYSKALRRQPHADTR